MPLLDQDSLAGLRDRQKQAVLDNWRCPQCGAQTWPNYCRECDEEFEDGHYVSCEEWASLHAGHRKY